MEKYKNCIILHLIPEINIKYYYLIIYKRIMSFFCPYFLIFLLKKVEIQFQYKLKYLKVDDRRKFISSTLKKF